MSPPPKRKSRTVLYVILGLFLAVLPIGLRLGAVKWLNEQGVNTQIEDIDLNLFTGRVAIVNAHGETDQGNGFKIAHAVANIDYWPLFSKQIYLSNVELRDSRVDVTLDDQDQLSVAGIPIVPGEEQPPEPEDEDATPWGFGLERAAIGKLTLRYEQPNFKREITLSSSSTRDLATWDPNEPFPIDAALTIDNSQINIKGNLQPFGDRIIGKLDLVIKDFALGLIAPLAEQGGVATLAGTVNTNLAIALDYQAQAGLDIQAKGNAKVALKRVEIYRA
jgi:uncharacterized protein involved in outer membrane biogenesis